MLHQSIMMVPHISADHLVLCLNFPLESVSPDIRSFFIEPELCIVRPIYFNLPIMTKVSRECLGIIWLVTDAFIFLAVHGIISFSFICFPLHLYSTAGKTIFYSSLTFVLVETSKSFLIFVKFCHCWFAQAYSFLGLFFIVAVIGDEMHQELVVGSCAAIFTIWKDVYILYSAHYCSFL